MVQALKITAALFNGDIKSLSADEIEMGFNDLPSYDVDGEIGLLDALVNSKLSVSKREAREFVNNGAITINGEKTTDLNLVLNKNSAIDGRFIVLRRGKKKYGLLRF